VKNTIKPMKISKKKGINKLRKDYGEVQAKVKKFVENLEINDKIYGKIKESKILKRK